MSYYRLSYCHTSIIKLYGWLELELQDLEFILSWRSKKSLTNIFKNWKFLYNKMHTFNNWLLVRVASTYTSLVKHTGSSLSATHKLNASLIVLKLMPHFYLLGSKNSIFSWNTSSSITTYSHLSLFSNLSSPPPKVILWRIHPPPAANMSLAGFSPSHLPSVLTAPRFT